MTFFSRDARESHLPDADKGIVAGGALGLGLAFSLAVWLALYFLFR